jgi:replicative DNA helicase
MRSFCKRVRRKTESLGLVVIDHLQFIQPPPRLEGPAAIAAITRDLKAMAKDLGVPIILVSHLNRDIGHRENKRPMLSDLFGSSAIEKDADAVLFVHRDHYWLARQGPPMPENGYDHEKADELRDKWLRDLKEIEHDADLILAKRRRGRGDGCIGVNFNPETTKFYDRIGPRLL